MLTRDKITEIYCIADDFCKEFASEFKKIKTLQYLFFLFRIFVV